jgi:hypothetical protein
MNIIYIYIYIYIYTHLFMFLNCTKFGFEFVSQKIFEMKILKITRVTYLVISHVKMIVCQNVDLPHSYDHHPQKHPFMI